MKKIIISIIFVSVMFSASAQNGYETVLQTIEANSSTLAALREQMEAQKLGNRTGIYLANPEVEFHYLWGNPDIIGNRTDFTVKQSFDFPTAYSHRGKIADLQNTNAEMQYKAERINLLLAAKKVCVELVYYNTLTKEYAARLQNAERIAATYQSRMAKGDANVLENNKAQLNLTTVQNEMARIGTEQATLLSQLKGLNGGKELDNYELKITNYDTLSTRNSQFVIRNSALPANFEDWYASAEPKSPVLQYIGGQIEISKRQIKLNQAMGLPKFSAGYMSEAVTGERFQGVMVGVSVPLWENKNRVKHAKAQVTADESVLADTKVQFYNRLQSLYLKASGLQQNALKYRQSITANSNEPLLKKALDAGEISLLTYLMEVEYYYDAINKVLEAERDFELAVAELNSIMN